MDGVPGSENEGKGLWIKRGATNKGNMSLGKGRVKEMEKINQKIRRGRVPGTRLYRQERGVLERRRPRAIANQIKEGRLDNWEKHS